MSGAAGSRGLTVGLTGATGHIGGVLLRRLLDDPEVSQVRTVARRPLPAALLGHASHGRLTHITSDLRGPGGAASL